MAYDYFDVNSTHSLYICFVSALSTSIPNPEDVEIYEQDTARFECKATGNPKPRIR